ncbi:MAG: Nif3-like dinuclear metal center protein, partial [Spirochaetales bacterium]|nr:Nif3-like dinuclear metal center protein [Spirochaetales bacterium]
MTKHDINLLAYHLPIDCHPELGNNACMARRLNLSEVQSHTAGGTPHLLWTGRLPEAITADALAALLNKTYQRQPQCISG